MPTRKEGDAARAKAKKIAHDAVTTSHRAAAKRQQDKRKSQKKTAGNRFTNPDGSPKNRPKTPEDRKFKDMPICGAQRSKNYADDPDNPGQCNLTAGWGTDHPGYGHCKWHGGSNPNGKKFAEREKLAAEMIEHEKQIIHLYGNDIDVDPHAALAMEVRRTSGHVAWLQSKIRDLEDEELFQVTPSGRTASALLQVYQSERDRLVSVCKAAITAGVAERQITLAEEQGRLIAMVIRDILYDPALKLTPQQRHDSGSIVRRHLIALDDPNKLQELTAG